MSIYRIAAYPAFSLSGLLFRHIRPDSRESTVYDTEQNTPLRKVKLDI